LPELPDLTVYLESLEARIANRRLLRIVLLNPFLLRTALPPIGTAEGRTVQGQDRLGKRIVIGLEGNLYLVLHLMVAGRLRWDARPPRTRPTTARAARPADASSPTARCRVS